MKGTFGSGNLVIEFDDSNIFCEAYHVCWHTRLGVPTWTDHPDRKSYETVVTLRAQTVHGAWPVHLIFPESSPTDDGQFAKLDCYCVMAKCYTYPKTNDGPGAYCILVWYQESAHPLLPGEIKAHIRQIDLYAMGEVFD